MLGVMMASLLAVAGCGSGGGDTAWKYTSPISSPIKATSGSQDVKLGDLNSQKVQVAIPGGSFDKNTALVLENPDKVPKVVGAEFSPIGAPIQISTGDKETRMNEPVTITLKLDPSTYGTSAKQPGDFWATYYDGEKWEYIKPDKVDLEAGTLTFTTYHFSLFGAGKVSVEEQVSKFAHDKAVGEWAQENVDQRMEDAAKKIVDHILVDKLKIEDESVKKKVIANLLLNDEWGDIVSKAKKGDVTGMNESLQVLAGKTIVDFVPKSTLSKSLEHLTSNLGLETVKKASEAAGYLAEGNGTEAARIIGEHIADQFIFTTAARLAVAAVQCKIETWKNGEIEAAYQAWKNGANSSVPFWGYQVEKGNFDDVWEQMKGARRQIEIDAISAQEKIRREAGMPPLTDKEKDNIRAMAAKNMQDMFNQRLKEDEEVAKQEEEIKKLGMLFKDNNLLTPGEWGYPDSYYGVDQRMEELIHFKDKVLRDTKRKGLTDGAFSNKVNISHSDLVALTMAWYTKPDGPQKYAQMLKDKYGIILAPKAEEMVGSWTGTFTITKLNLPPAEPAGSQSKEGCDIGDIRAQLEAMKGKPMPSSFNMQLNAGGTGTMTVVINSGNEGGDPVAMPCTYADGKITASISEKDGTMKFTGNATSTDKDLVVNGTWILSGSSEGKTMSISGTWKATKPKPVPPPAPAKGTQAGQTGQTPTKTP